MENCNRKTCCWACKSLDVIKCGKQNNKQRFMCKSCGILFTADNLGVSSNNELVWFRKWVVERQTLSILSRDIGLSERTVRRKFVSYLVASEKLIFWQ